MGKLSAFPSMKIDFGPGGKSNSLLPTFRKLNIMSAKIVTREATIASMEYCELIMCSNDCK